MRKKKSLSIFVNVILWNSTVTKHIVARSQREVTIRLFFRVPPDTLTEFEAHKCKPCHELNVEKKKKKYKKKKTTVERWELKKKAWPRDPHVIKSFIGPFFSSSSLLFSLFPIHSSCLFVYDPKKSDKKKLCFFSLFYFIDKKFLKKKKLDVAVKFIHYTNIWKVSRRFLRLALQDIYNYNLIKKIDWIYIQIWYWSSWPYRIRANSTDLSFQLIYKKMSNK